MGTTLQKRIAKVEHQSRRQPRKSSTFMGVLAMMIADRHDSKFQTRPIVIAMKGKT